MVDALLNSAWLYPMVAAAVWAVALFGVAIVLFGDPSP